jgi:hypothetical protein
MSRRVGLRTRAMAALVLAAAAGACRPAPAPSAPAIAFTVVPEAGAGGAERLADIAGRVDSARPGQRLVLYARTNVWWVQPFANQPFTTIEADGTFATRIHLGEEYAALVVEDGHRPPSTIETMPGAGDGIAAVAIAKGTGDYTKPALKTLSFSGYDWEVRRESSDRGGANEYDPAHVWTDADGALHLKLARVGGVWKSAELHLTRALGYGTYAFTVRDVSGLDPSAAFGMLTWDDEGAEQNHRELDVEVSQWGDPSIANAQFVVQPYYVAANVFRFTAPPGRLTHTFRWEPGRALFRIFKGAGTTGRALVTHESTSGIPTPGSERVVMNLYYFRYGPKPPQSDVEVVVERFQHIP